MSLKEYQAKRNFRRTSEPAGRSQKKSAAVKEPFFVIQKHDATRLHYDFRLEMDGVLKSWAVPKGFPAKRGDRRLAVEVEDHPIDYAQFEGTIPAGNYGAGTVLSSDERYTSIEFDNHGRKVFITDMVTLTKSDEPAPNKPAKAKRKKAAAPAAPPAEHD